MVVAAGGGILIGVVGAFVFGYLHKRIKDPLLDNALSLLIPFAVVIPAEEIGASGVVAVVVAGLALGHRMPLLMSAASRLQMDAFWRLVQFLLEGLVFLLVGLQLRDIVRATGHSRSARSSGSPRRCSAPSCSPGSSGCSRPPTCPGWFPGSAAATRRRRSRCRW